MAVKLPADRLSRSKDLLWNFNRRTRRKLMQNHNELNRRGGTQIPKFTPEEFKHYQRYKQPAAPAPGALIVPAPPSRPAPPPPAEEEEEGIPRAPVRVSREIFRELWYNELELFKGV